jgi:hypothetical protein
MGEKDLSKRLGASGAGLEPCIDPLISTKFYYYFQSERGAGAEGSFYCDCQPKYHKSPDTY